MTESTSTGTHTVGQWLSRGDPGSFSPVPGITIWQMSSDTMMLIFAWLEPGVELPLHEHPHEQAGTVVQGELQLTVGDVTRVLQPGDAYLIPGGTPHRGLAGSEGCLAVDVFSPPREDYRRKGS